LTPPPKSTRAKTLRAARWTAASSSFATSGETSAFDTSTMNCFGMIVPSFEVLVLHNNYLTANGFDQQTNLQQQATTDNTPGFFEFLKNPQHGSS
jgi:hypothetical protein